MAILLTHAMSLIAFTRERFLLKTVSKGNSAVESEQLKPESRIWGGCCLSGIIIRKTTPRRKPGRRKNSVGTSRREFAQHALRLLPPPSCRGFQPAHAEATFLCNRQTRKPTSVGKHPSENTVLKGSLLNGMGGQKGDDRSKARSQVADRRIHEERHLPSAGCQRHPVE